MKTLLLIAVILLLFILSPLLGIWSLNTISEQASMGWYIPHNFWTYLAFIVIVAIANGNSGK